MDRARVWPAFDDAWIVHEDEDIVVVAKPDGVPTQAADPERPDDVVSRLSAHRGWSYLGVHQRLDRDTSGVLVFAKRREANAGLARQLEGRAVEKKYLAGVVGWPSGKKDTTLRDWLAPGDDGRVRVVRKGDRGGQEAVTRVRVLERVGDRTLLELVLETGRTHQARVQLANAGAPIAGDILYGRAAAPRLMLHARSIGLEHPTRGQRVTYEAETPWVMTEWLARGDRGAAIYDEPRALEEALARAVRKRYALGHASEGPRATDVFRLVNEAGDALPRLAVDVYGAHLVAQLYEDDDAASVWSDEARRTRVLDALGALGFDGVYLKLRPKQANTLVDTRRDDVAPRSPVRGTPAPDPLPVVEEGVTYLARLGDGLSTGIFLDQRANRRKVRELSGGASVVNLFSYECAFTVAAAAGGAWRTISVDASAVALERGREQLRHAGLLETAEHRFVAEDAFAWLAQAQKRGERHDLVILDPPSYSTTKKTRFVASSDYPKLAAAALAIVRPGGRLLACTNHRGISADKFRRQLFDAGRLAKIELSQVKDMPAPLDFPLPPGGASHLKCAMVTLARENKPKTKV